MFKVTEKILSCKLDQLAAASVARLPVIFEVRSKTFVDCHQQLLKVEAACRDHCGRRSSGFQMPAAGDPASRPPSRLTFLDGGKYVFAEQKIFLILKLASDQDLDDRVSSIAANLDHMMAFMKEHSSVKEVGVSFSTMQLDGEKTDDGPEKLRSPVAPGAGDR